MCGYQFPLITSITDSVRAEIVLRALQRTELSAASSYFVNPNGQKVFFLFFTVTEHAILSPSVGNGGVAGVQNFTLLKTNDKTPRKSITSEVEVLFHISELLAV